VTGIENFRGFCSWVASGVLPPEGLGRCARGDVGRGRETGGCAGPFPLSFLLNRGDVGCPGRGDIERGGFTFLAVGVSTFGTYACAPKNS
jgi:hypothetical protein